MARTHRSMDRDGQPAVDRDVPVVPHEFIPNSELPGPVGPVEVRTVPEQGGAAARGLLAGLAGAVAFTLFCMAAFAASGAGMWKPLNLVAYTFWSGAPTHGRFDGLAALVGLGILAVGGVAMGLPLALLLHNIGVGQWALLLGLAIVIPNVLWVFGHNLVWPAINPQAAELFTPLWAWLGHSVYGLVFGLTMLATSHEPGEV